MHAQDRADREVAIKLLRADRLASQPDARVRIIREARAMARVSHPNVITVFDAGTVGDQVFIAAGEVRDGGVPTPSRQSSRSAPVPE
jgi:serine/threonine protein kinase